MEKLTTKPSSDLLSAMGLSFTVSIASISQDEAIKSKTGPAIQQYTPKASYIR